MKKVLAATLAGLMINLAFIASAPANSRPDKGAQLVAKVKVAVAKLGTGSSARIEIKLSDGARLKGYVSETAEDDFVIVDDRTGGARAIPYPQVRHVKGNNLSTGAKIVIGVGIVIGVLAFVGWLARGS